MERHFIDRFSGLAGLGGAGEIQTPSKNAVGVSRNARNVSDGEGFPNASWARLWPSFLLPPSRGYGGEVFYLTQRRAEAESAERFWSWGVPQTPNANQSTSLRENLTTAVRSASLR